MCRFSSIDSLLNFFGWMISYGCCWLMIFARELKPETKTNKISFIFGYSFPVIFKVLFFRNILYIFIFI